MIDARISVGLPSHPKTKKLIRRCGASGAWRLVCLFLWAAANKPDGDLAGMTVEDIELAADWDGDDGRFVAVMVEVGFLDVIGDGYQIHDWNIHNPWAAGSEARSEKARWLATCKHHGREKASELMPEYAERLLRSASSTPTVESKHSDSMQKSEFSCAPSPSPSPLPSPNSKEIAAAATEQPSTENQEKLPPPSNYSKERAKTLADRLMGLESKRLGRTFHVTAENSTVAAWGVAGVKDPQFREAYEIALDRRKKDGSDQPISPAFLDKLIRDVMSDEARPSPAIPVKPWHETASGIEAKAKELGIPRDPGGGLDPFPAFTSRVFKAAGMIAEAA